MIKFKNLNQDPPYLLLKMKYEEALSAGQSNIEAMAISSVNKKKNEVESRYVNLKFIIDNDFIFFSNCDT